jgi:hypothetical protein
MERETCLQGILHIFQIPHLSSSPVKEPSLKVPSWNPSQRDAPPLQPSFIHLSKSPVYEHPPHTRFPSNGKGPPRREMVSSGDLSNISSRVPNKGASPEAPSTEPLKREMPHPQSPLHPVRKVPGRQALLQVPQAGPLWKDMPVSRAFSTYPSGSPAREPSPQVPFTELPHRETLKLQSSFQPHLKLPGR